MNTIKSLALVGVATTALFAAQAFATVCPSGTQGGPTCIATTGGDGPNSSLQQQLNAMTTSGPQLNVYTGQYTPSSYWSIGASDQSANKIMLELAGNAGSNTFGIYDPSNSGNYLQLFNGPASAGSKTLLTQFGNTYTAAYLNSFGVQTGYSQITINGNVFGYYLGVGSAAINPPSFYSDPAKNAPGGTVYPLGMHNMVAFAGNDLTYLNSKKFVSGETILAWEDTSFAHSDLDYNDFVVLVESVHSVPEPGVLGMFGLGALLIGGFAGLRRRRRQVV